MFSRDSHVIHLILNSHKGWSMWTPKCWSPMDMLHGGASPLTTSNVTWIANCGGCPGGLATLKLCNHHITIYHMPNHLATNHQHYPPRARTLQIERHSQEFGQGIWSRVVVNEVVQCVCVGTLALGCSIMQVIELGMGSDCEMIEHESWYKSSKVLWHTLFLVLKGWNCHFITTPFNLRSC